MTPCDFGRVILKLQIFNFLISMSEISMCTLAEKIGISVYPIIDAQTVAVGVQRV